MNSSSNRLSPRYVRTHEAAAFLSLSGRTLEKHRCTGTGPVFRKLGGRVVYAIEDLEAWAAEHARNSTADPKPENSANHASALPIATRRR